MKKLFRYGLLAIGILAVLSAAGVWYLSSRDVGAAFVAKTAKELAAERFGADLAIGSISGNPLRGFTADSVVLSKDETIITIDETQIRLDLFSLVKGSPRIRSVRLKGADLRLEPLQKLSQDLTTAPSGELPLSSIYFDDSTLRTKTGNFLFDDGTVSLTSAGLAVESTVEYKGVDARVNAEFQFARGNLHLEKLLLAIGEGRVKLSGDLYPEIDAGGTITDLDMKTLGRFWPEIGEDTLTGSFSTNIKVSGIWPDFGARGEISIDKGTLYGISLAGARSSWWYRGDKLWFEEISGVANGSPVSGTAGLVFGKCTPETHLDLQATAVKLVDWQKTFPWLSVATGTLERLDIDLCRSGGLFSGPVSFTAPSMEIFRQPLGKVHASLSLQENGNVAVDADAYWLDAPVRATGTIIPGKGPSFDFTVEGKDIGLHKVSRVFPTENFALQGNAEGTVRISGTGRDVRYEGDLRSEKIRIREELVDSPRLSFHYDGTNVNLKSFSALWKGLPVKGSGTVLGLGNEKASLNLSGSTGGVKISSLEGFVPGLSDAGLAGDVTASWELSGRLTNPSLALELTSPELSAPSGITVSGLESSISVPLPFESAASPVKATARAAEAGYGKFTLTDLSAAFSTGEGAIILDAFTAKAFSGALEASGKIQTAPQEGNTPVIDLSGNLTGVDLSVFSSEKRPVSGEVTGSFTAAGPLAQPDVSFEAAVPEFLVMGYMVTELNLSGTAVPEGVKFDAVSARIGEGVISGEGMLSFKEDGSVADFSVTGSGLDLKYLTSELRAAGKAGLEGTLDVNLEGAFEDGQWSGSGEVFAETFSAYGFTVRDVYIPVRLEEQVVTAEKAKGDFYGGAVAADATATLGSNFWTVNAQVSGFDISGALDDAFDFEGEITGKADLKLNLEHGKSTAMPLRGQGRFTATDGEISGFEAVQAITSTYGGTGIRYSRADSSFSLGGNMVSLMPGSRMTAPPGDPLYRYMSVDGTVAFSSKLDLYCSGNVNIQALSTFFGALEGLLGSESLDPQHMLENLLGGFLGGISKRDFRDVSFDIEGNWEQPVISKVKVAVPEKRADPIPSTGDPETKNDERKITIEIPTGGETGNGDSVGDQIKQQILEQIFIIDD
ncbi:MAG: AsmA-like C-terminal region-containing protein [Thermovirgaceae bacterium]